MDRKRRDAKTDKDDVGQKRKMDGKTEHIGEKAKSLSNLYAQLALAPESKKYLIQRIIDLLEKR